MSDERNKVREPFSIITKPEPEVRISPFLYRKNYKVEKARIRECSNHVIRQLIRKQELEDVDIIILNGLLEYEFLSGFMLRQYIAYIEDNVKIMVRDAFRNRIKKLMNIGLVEQMELMRNEDGVLKGSAFIYGLSKSGLRFLKFINPSISPKHELPEFRIEQVLNLLVSNQFIIMMQRQYSNSISGKFMGRDIEEQSGARAVFKIWLPDQQQLNLFVFAVRDSEYYKEYFLSRLRKIVKYQQEKKESYAVLVICESENQAMNCERYKSCDSQLVKMDVVYMTDTSGVSNDVLGRLIEVLPQQDYSIRNIFKLVLENG